MSQLIECHDGMYQIRDVSDSDPPTTSPRQNSDTPSLCSINHPALSHLSETSRAHLSSLSSGLCREEPRAHSESVIVDGHLPLCSNHLAFLSAYISSARRSCPIQYTGLDVGRILGSVMYTGTPNVLHGLQHQPGGVPVAYYLQSGHPRIWITMVWSTIVRLPSCCAYPSPSLPICTHLASVSLDPCFWRHSRRFIHPLQLVKKRIPFTIHVQHAGDMVILDGLALVQSWDTGVNSVLAVPFLDSASAVGLHNRVEADVCACSSPNDPQLGRRNAIVDTLLHLTSSYR